MSHSIGGRIVNRMRRPVAHASTTSRERSGFALILVLVLVFAIGACAMAAIYVNSNAGLIGRMGEKEKELRYAADASLQIGKSLLNNEPTALPDSGYSTLISNGTLAASDGTPIPNVTYNLYVGPTGSTTGQFGRFASVVSEADGPRGARFIRRLELEQESFARYAYWSNKELDASGGIIYFAGGDVLWGPVWSNDVINIHSSGATFHDDVGTAKTISGVSNGTFDKGYRQNETPITLPTITSLVKLPGYATSGSLNFNAPTNGDQSTVLMRLEFVAIDMNLDGDSTDANEGYVRVYTANAGEQAWTRADWTTNKASAVNCGDFHRVLVAGVPAWKFFPGITHGTAGSTLWARTLWINSGDYTAATATAHGGLTQQQIMAQPLAAGQPAHRCFPGGDPHLVAVERNANGGVVAGQIGGDPTTFTANGARGSWRLWPGAVDPTLAARRPADAAYLFPLYRAQNTGVKGVIYVNGTVGVSGVLRGRLTVYAKNAVVILDDLRYASDPAGGICNDIMGIIGGTNIVVADNAINTPQDVGAAPNLRNFDDTKDLYLHSVLMALNTSFTVENYNAGPNDANDCGTINWGRGCLFLTGGLIQDRRGAVGTTGGTGFLKRYSYDRCAVQIPPPYFPTTGRFLDNRYSELDPQRFDVALLFASLTPGP